MSLVSSEEECELAATKLGLSDTTALSTESVRRPHGCTYEYYANYLNWRDPLSSPQASAPCGSKDGRNDYDCLCSTHGEG